MLTALLLIAGFAFTVYGADLLVGGASSLAKKLKVSNLVIGLTVVAFGTSAPELTVNITSSLSGATEIALGNVLGSNIANILLILGISAAIYPLTVGKGTVWKEIPFALLAAVVLGIAASDALIDGNILSLLSRTDGLIFLAFFIIFLYYTFGIARTTGDSDGDDVGEMKLGKSIIYVVLGLVGLVLGGKWVVTGATDLALALGMSTTLVGLTIVAVGTSLPELATSAVAAYRRKVDIAIGNVVGSNIFNTFLVLGTSATVSNLPVQANLLTDLALNIAITLLLFITLFIGKRHTIERWQGVLYITLYIVYVGFLIQRG